MHLQANILSSLFFSSFIPKRTTGVRLLFFWLLLFENQIFISISLNFSEWTALSFPIESFPSLAHWDCLHFFFVHFHSHHTFFARSHGRREPESALSKMLMLWMGKFIIKISLRRWSHSVSRRKPSCAYRREKPRHITSHELLIRLDFCKVTSG